MATQCHTYQNIESTYQVVAENTVQTASEYTDLNDNTVSSSTPVSSKSSRLPKRFVRQINYTDILLDSPDVPGCNEIAIQEINEDIVSPIGAKTRPEPPPKPRKNKILAKSVENDNVGIEIAEKKETDEETEDSTNHKKERQSHYGRHMITSILFILVIVAIGIATSAITLAVLNFKRYQTCQEHSEYCTIDPEVNYTCSIHSNFKFKNTRVRLVYGIELNFMCCIYNHIPILQLFNPL